MSREREEHLSTAEIAAAADAKQGERLVQVETGRQEMARQDMARQETARQEMGRQPQVPPMPRNEMDGSHGSRADAGQLAQLFDPHLAEEMRGRWANIQSGFVDDPHRAVQEADELVAKALQDLARSFARHRSDIEAEARAGEQEPSTENLRVALRRYRSFFERLLSL